MVQHVKVCFNIAKGTREPLKLRQAPYSELYLACKSQKSWVTYFLSFL